MQGFDDLSEDIDDFDDIPNEADLDYEDQEDIGDLGSDLDDDFDFDNMSIDDIDVDDIEAEPTDSTEPVEGEQTEVIDATATGETAPEQTENQTVEPASTEAETDQPVQAEEAPPTEGTEAAPEGGEVIDATSGGGEEGADIENTEDLGADASLDTPSEDGTVDPNATADPNMDPNAATDPNAGQSVTKDDVRKHEMYKRFLDLYNAIVYFIERLESGVSDSERFEMASSKALSKFKRIEDLTRDYMLLKFQTDSFLQNSFFYEKIKAICLLNFKSLELNKIKKDESKH